MANHENADALWIGNYAYYNDGDLVGDWIELPFTDEEFQKFLRERVGVDAMHEEYGIFDTDLMGPFGEIGVKVGEYDDIDEMNLLAKVCAEHPEADLEAVRAFMDNQGSADALQYANAVVQSDEIPFYHWEDSSEGYSSDEEHFAYQELGNLGGPSALDAKELAEYFDFERYGRRLMDEGMGVGEDGFIDIDECTVVYDYDENIIAREAELILGSVERPSYEDARNDLINRWDILPNSIAVLDEDTVIDSYIILDDLESNLRDREAVLLYSKYQMSSLCTPLDYASVALQADDIAYTQWDWRMSAGSDAERLGRQYASMHGSLQCMDKDALSEYFDYERWGRDASNDYVFAKGGYLDCCQDGADLDFYTKEELGEMVDGIGFSESIANPYVDLTRRPAPSEISASASAVASIAEPEAASVQHGRAVR